jgi:hypothetical protein
MSIKKKHFGIVAEDGVEVVFDDIVSWKQDKLNHRGKKVAITIERRKKHRSGNQNRYFHSVIVPMIAEEMGCELDEAKDALKWEFLRFQLECGAWTVKATSNLSTVEMEEFHSKCRQLGSQMFGCYIPKPHEADY